MANLKVGNREFERSPVWIQQSAAQDPTMTQVMVDPLTGVGYVYRAGTLAIPATPFITTLGSLKCAVVADTDKLYWNIPLTNVDLNLPLTFGLGFTSVQALVAGETFTPSLKWQVLGPGSSATGDAAAGLIPPAPANLPDQDFGVHTLVDTSTWQWTGTGATPYAAAQQAVINASNLLPAQNQLSWLQVEVTFAFGLGLTDLAITDLFVQATPLITPTPDETVIDPILKA